MYCLKVIILLWMKLFSRVYNPTQSEKYEINIFHVEKQTSNRPRKVAALITYDGYCCAPGAHLLPELPSTQLYRSWMRYRF